MLYKLAWRNIWRNKRRTFITMGSVFFAVMLAILMRSLQEGSYEKMIENVVSFYTGYVQIHKEGYWDDQVLDNSFEATPVIKTATSSLPSVNEAVPRLESFALAASDSTSEPCLVVGADPEKENVLTGLQNKLVKGDYFKTGSAGAMIAEGLSEKLQLGIGDTLVLIGSGYHGVSAAGKYPITGLVRFGSPDLNDRLVYLPLEKAQIFYGAEGRLTSYALNLSNPDDYKAVVKDLKKGLDEGQYEIMDWTEMMPELVQMIESDRGGGIIMMGVLYVIIAFGMFGTVLMMIAERQYEFGVMTAVGMKKRKLATMVGLETIFISAMGIITGTIASLPFVLYLYFNPIYLGDSMAEAYAQFGMEAVFPASLDPAIFINQALTVLVFAVLVSIYPAIKIMQIDPVKAMHT
ncbi:MAG: ABC transporter permease [Bacteroidetes bacterium]|nr:ABC transporter permease [Bacteroidota bacterium]